LSISRFAAAILSSTWSSCWRTRGSRSAVVRIWPFNSTTLMGPDAGRGVAAGGGIVGCAAGSGWGLAAAGGALRV